MVEAKTTIQSETVIYPELFRETHSHLPSVYPELSGGIPLKRGVAESVSNKSRIRNPRLKGEPLKKPQLERGLPIRWDEEVSQVKIKRLNTIYKQGESDGFGEFMDRYANHPLLTQEQERLAFSYLGLGKSIEELAASPEFLGSSQDMFKAVFSSSESIRSFIAICNIRLVVSVAKKFRGRGFEFQDLVQEGIGGALRAVDGFELERDVKFSTYAVWWIRREISKAIYERNTDVYFPKHMKIKLMSAGRISEEFFKDNGRFPNAREVYDRLLLEPDITKKGAENVIRTLQSFVGDIGTLNAKIQGEDEDREVGDLVKDPSCDLEQEVLEHVARNQLRNDLILALSCLKPRNRKILELRFGLDQGGRARTLDEVSQIFHVSREAIRLTELRALKKLKPALKVFWEEMG